MDTFWQNVIAGAVSGVVSGMIVGSALYYTQRRIDKRDKMNFNFAKLRKRLPEDVFDHIRPGISMDKVITAFGSPETHFNEAWSLFLDDVDKPYPTHRYFYRFLNANMLVTSVDQVTIDTVTVFAADETVSNRYLIRLPFGSRNRKSAYLGQTLLTGDYMDHTKRHTIFRTIREMTWGVEIYGGWATQYLHYTYMGYHASQFVEYEKDQKPERLLGSTIHGLCISRIDGFAPAISMYE